MLGIAKVKRGQESYYFSTVQATTDMPDGLVEPDPVWLGSAAAALGLTGTPAIAEVRAILAGVDPHTGEVLEGREPSRVRNVAYDFVFSVPKSVSIVHALSSPDASAAIEKAFDTAVAAAVTHLESEVLRARLSAHGRQWTEKVGVLAAAFKHRTSRANDPHLHTHVVIANLGQCSSSKWRAVDSRHLYASSGQLRVLFEAQLRYELTEIGVDLGRMRGQFADIAGFGRDVIEPFSRRASEISEGVAVSGWSGSEAYRLVADLTRPPKDRSKPYVALVEEWRERGHALGLSASRIERAAGTGVRRAVNAGEWVEPGWVERAADPVDGTFTRRDLIFSRCASSVLGAPVDEILRDVDIMIASAEIVAVGERFTTEAQRAVTRAESERLGALGNAAGLRLLSYDRGERLAALDTAAALATACELDGNRAFGVGLGARAAAAFEAATGIETFPVKQFGSVATELRQGDLVVLADCAGMTAAEHSRVLGACERSGARPVLVARAASLDGALLLESVRAQATAVPLQLDARTGERSILPTAAARQLGPNVRAIVVAHPAAGRAAAAALAAQARTDGRETLVVVPEVSIGARLDSAFVAAGDLKAVLAERAVPPHLVVVGGAGPLGLSAPELARLERTHVVVDGGSGSGIARLGRVAEAVQPGHLTKTLGAVARTAPERARWRLGAGEIESLRERRGLWADRSAFGSRKAGTFELAVDAGETRRRVEKLGPARGRSRSPDHSLGR